MLVERVFLLDIDSAMTILDIQSGSNMTGIDVARFTHKQSRSYLNHLVISRVHLPSLVIMPLKYLKYFTLCSCFIFYTYPRNIIQTYLDKGP